MSSAKHTPGPWRYNIDTGRVEAGKDIVIGSIRAYLSDTGHANGKLIACAPELLEALDYLLRETVDMDLKYGIALSEGEEDAGKRALAVIAKVAA